MGAVEEKDPQDISVPSRGSIFLYRITERLPLLENHFRPLSGFYISLFIRTHESLQDSHWISVPSRGSIFLYEVVMTGIIFLLIISVPSRGSIFLYDLI